MFDVYATSGTFADKHALAQELATAVMRWEQVPDLALFRNDTAVFVHGFRPIRSPTKDQHEYE